MKIKSKSSQKLANSLENKKSKKQPGQLFDSPEVEKQPEVDFKELFVKYGVKPEQIVDVKFGLEVLGFKLYLSNQLLSDAAIVYNKLKELVKNDTKKSD